MDIQEGIKLLEDRFGSRESFLGFQLVQLSISGQPFDVTFYDRPPLINVKLGPKLSSAMMYGAGAHKISELLSNIKFSDGSRASMMEIWTINAMPSEGFTESQLKNVDLAEAEEIAGPQGETLREMIRATYKCKSKDEEDQYLRRFIAS